jgi:SAM-dependent methyltransferase
MSAAAALLESARRAVAGPPARLDDDAAEALARLCDAYAARALDGLDAAAVLPLYAAHLVPRWRARAHAGDVDTLLARVRELVAAPLADFVARCGAALAAVATGEIDPLELYLVDETTTYLYEASPVAERLNRAVAAVVAAAAPARVLEVGAGTGGTTRAVIAQVAPERYTFTDLSTLLLRRARRRLPQPFFRFAVLDIERDPAAQGLAVGEHDVVVAANVLHAARDLDAALAHARALLAPGGAVVLWEATRDETWFDVTIALLPGWHRHADAHRAGGPLVGAAVWEQLLARAGLEPASLVSDGQAVVVGRLAP